MLQSLLTGGGDVTCLYKKLLTGEVATVKKVVARGDVSGGDVRGTAAADGMTLTEMKGIRDLSGVAIGPQSLGCQGVSEEAQVSKALDLD